MLARVAGYARRSGHSLKLTAARPSLLRIMRITGMDEAFPEVRTPTLAMISLAASGAGDFPPWLIAPRAVACLTRNILCRPPTRNSWGRTGTIDPW